MTWIWIAGVVAGCYGSWRTLIKRIVHPNWKVRVSGRNGSSYRHNSLDQAMEVGVSAQRCFRSGDSSAHSVLVGIIRLDDPEFDEKFLDLRDRARERVKQLNRFEKKSK